MNKTDLVQIRNEGPLDRNFILATFLRGLYYGESIFSEMKKQTFMSYYPHVIQALLDNPNTKVQVACLKDDPEVILGYCILPTPDSVAWVFVKKSWRGIGLAKDLVPETVKNVTHLTKVGLSITKKRGLVFNPFIT